MQGICFAKKRHRFVRKSPLNHRWPSRHPAYETPASTHASSLRRPFYSCPGCPLKPVIDVVQRGGGSAVHKGFHKRRGVQPVFHGELKQPPLYIAELALFHCKVFHPIHLPLQSRRRICPHGDTSGKSPALRPFLFSRTLFRRLSVR